MNLVNLKRNEKETVTLEKVYSPMAEILGYPFATTCLDGNGDLKMEEIKNKIASFHKEYTKNPISEYEMDNLFAIYLNDAEMEIRKLSELEKEKDNYPDGIMYEDFFGMDIDRQDLDNKDIILLYKEDKNEDGKPCMIYSLTYLSYSGVERQLLRNKAFGQVEEDKEVFMIPEDIADIKIKKLRIEKNKEIREKMKEEKENTNMNQIFDINAENVKTITDVVKGMYEATDKEGNLKVTAVHDEGSVEFVE